MLAKAIKRSRIVRFLIDLRLTVVCLALLFVLTFLGTVHQYSFGLYSAQKEYFESFFTLVGGLVPLPGAQLVLWVLFVNLVAATIYRFSYKANRVGILIIHGGLFALFFGMFFTQYFAQESFLELAEGEGRNVSTDYFHWELAVWDADAATRRVAAVDLADLEATGSVRIEEYEIELALERVYHNAEAYTTQAEAGERERLNSSGIGLFQELRVSSDPQENFPGVLATVSGAGARVPLILYSRDLAPTSFLLGERRLSASLRRKAYQMPLTVTLQDFRAEFYPNSDVPASFESDVLVTAPGSDRTVRISMNSPFRFEGYTFYQASYRIDATGSEWSTLAVVENRSRLVPYIGTGILGLGLAVHFTQVLAKRTRREGARNAA